MADRLMMDALLLCKVETTSGTDSTPVQATDAVRLEETFDPTVTYLVATPRDKVVRGTKRNAAAPLTPSARYGEWSMKTFVRGARTTAAYSASILPDLDPILQAAGLAGVGSFGAGTENWLYNIASSALKTVTAYSYSGGELRKLLGARSDFTFGFKAGGPVEASFKLTGLYQDKADVATPGSPAFGTAIAPVAETAAVTFGAFSTGIVRECSISSGNTIQQRPNANATKGLAYPFLPYARPTFKLVLEDPLIADIDLETLQKSATKNVFTWTVGSVQYNRVKFSTGGAVIEQYLVSNDNGIPIVTMSGVLVDSTDTAVDAFAIKFD